ncbi:MAG: 2-C-methyl-D-erythritol 4-phosphate cytidylyltransferase [Acidimicrobiia bacterium]|nr:2-C-methyl-D-erythritol 4-phosphate cytidylyltransferase [Acidimicrobiia bacterium]MDH5290768.1 2-C-methyl-D-erythritol 4-phosphate cytidylyltransferase [Acidimicrobiia bacterium]
MDVWGVVVAGGGGSRYGGLKQFELLAGRRVLDWSIAALAPVCRGVVVVVPAAVLDQLQLPMDVVGVAGGHTRSDSVRAGLDALPVSASHVLVHDAARPLVTAEVVGRVRDALAGGAVAAVPVMPVTDSLRMMEGRAVDRSGLVAVQTPQGFRVDVLRLAHSEGDTATDDASLVDRLGLTVVHVEGDPTNMKITDPHDLRIAEVLLHDR